MVSWESIVDSWEFTVDRSWDSMGFTSPGKRSHIAHWKDPPCYYWEDLRRNDFNGHFPGRTFCSMTRGQKRRFRESAGSDMQRRLNVLRLILDFHDPTWHFFIFLHPSPHWLLLKSRHHQPRNAKAVGVQIIIS